MLVIMTLTLDPRVLAAANDRLQELVGNVLFVVCLDGLDRVVGLLTDTVDQTIDGDLDPLPSLITIHGVVPSDDGRDLANSILLAKVLQFSEVLGGRTRSGVTTIAEEVDENLGNAVRFGGLEKSEQMTDVGVNTTVRHLK
jgi:hypothetical protein